MRAVFKYPGSKWRIAEWIVSFFPEHHSYLEPFFGSGAVLFNKPRSNIETVNDLNGEIVNLYRWIRENPEALAKQIRLTPYARDVYESAYQTAGDDLQRAVNMLIKMQMGHGFRVTGEKVGWKMDIQGREKAYAASQWRDLPDVIWQTAERLRGVQIENRPAVDVIRRFRFPNVLIYADPPYLMETRCGRKQYSHEMTDADHMELLEALKNHPGPVLLSGYESELYSEMLSDWNRETISSADQKGRPRTEILWMNFEPPAKQYSIFERGKGTVEC